MKKARIAIVLIAILSLFAGCNINNPPSQSDSGIKKATVQVSADSEGLTTEQRNIRDRLTEDNKPGSIKHLYVISAYSGQVIIYSTVRGKVTSSGKRLTPTEVSTGGDYPDSIPVQIGNWSGHTHEVLQDDGSYGSSVGYLYWWDTKGVSHQHYVSGGQILHISSEPLAVKGIIINMEVTQAPANQ